MLRKNLWAVKNGIGCHIPCFYILVQYKLYVQHMYMFLSRLTCARHRANYFKLCLVDKWLWVYNWRLIVWRDCWWRLRPVLAAGRCPIFSWCSITVDRRAGCSGWSGGRGTTRRRGTVFIRNRAFHFNFFLLNLMIFNFKRLIGFINWRKGDKTKSTFSFDLRNYFFLIVHMYVLTTEGLYKKYRPSLNFFVSPVQFFGSKFNDFFMSPLVLCWISTSGSLKSVQFVPSQCVLLKSAKKYLPF